MQSLLERQLETFEAIKNIKLVPELLQKHNGIYVVSSVEEILVPIILANDVIIVAGAYFGDEGKGKETDAVGDNPLVTIIVRANSGENAGHTVWHDGKKYIFNITPSGIMIPGKTCLIGPECVMDPVNFAEKELSQLIDAGVNYKERLFVGNAHIVGPYHKILDFALSPPNSSTLMGISHVHSSKASKKGLRMDDLFNSKDAQVKSLNKDLKTYFALIKDKPESQILDELREFSQKRKIPDHLFGFLEANDKVEYILDLYRRVVVQNDAFPERRDVNHAVNQALARGEKVLIESPQSFWLSNATGNHWASSTSAQTHATGVLASTRINLSKYKVAVINVAKTPGDSRVGIGANPSSFVPQDYFSSQDISNLGDLEKACTDFDTIQKLYFESIQENGILNPIEYEDATGKYSISGAMAIASSKKFREEGATTKKPRVTGVFDCLAAYQVNDAQGPHLFISAMDRGDFQDKVGMTVAYIFHKPDKTSVVSNGNEYKNGDIIGIGDPYPCDNVLAYCHPIVKVMPGWKDTPIAAEKRNPKDPLPESVQSFIGAVEDFTGFRVIGIGNGHDTKNVIYIKRK